MGGLVNINKNNNNNMEEILITERDTLRFESENSI